MIRNKSRLIVVLNLVIGFSVCPIVHADENSALAQELANPLASLISAPIQMNFDQDIGVNDQGSRITTNIQPVIPFDISQDWNLITRTVIPIVDQSDIYPGSGSQFGLSDIVMSLFFSPKKPTSGGLVWGVGPVFLLPTATDSLLGSDKWGAGPTAVALKVSGPWTYGGLANHIWSIAGDSNSNDISTTFIQPFAAYTWPSAWTASVQSETTYNWKTQEWAIPVNVSVSKLVRFGKLPVSLQGGIGYWFESPDTGPKGMRYRLQVTFVLPKGS